MIKLYAIRNSFLKKHTTYIYIYIIQLTIKLRKDIQVKKIYQNLEENKNWKCKNVITKSKNL